MKKSKKFNKKSFIIQSLRRISYRLPSRSEAIRRARVGRNQYKCALCGKICKNKEYAMDHVIPVVDPLDGFIDWNNYVERMLPDDAEAWQLLCRIDNLKTGELSCNTKKTKAENLIRKQQRDLKKPKKVKKSRRKK
jgi:5-methylcytosine-specific restriction endonuclease McrA